MVTQYPADTVIWILSMLLREASAFLGVVTIANVAGGFGRWNLYELCLLFSMCAIIDAAVPAISNQKAFIYANLVKNVILTR